MPWFDAAILLIVAFSALVGLFRGLIKEAVSLSAWILGIWIAMQFSGAFAQLLPDSLQEVNVGIGELRFKIENMRIGIAMVVLFIVTLIVGSIVAALLRRLVHMAQLGVLDRLLGIAFGVLRGGVIIVGIVLLAGLTSIPSYPFWTQSEFIPHFQEMTLKVIEALPQDMAAHFEYAN